MSISEVAAAERTLQALRNVREGRVISLDSGWWRGMPVEPVHPQFEVMTYRTPAGERIEGDVGSLAGSVNAVGYGFVSELITGTVHSGTHIDALCHVVAGEPQTWHGGYAAAEHLGDHGALVSDASELLPMVTRGLMLDVPRALGVECLPAHYPISADDLERSARTQGVEPSPGDVVLIRTGAMKIWPKTSDPDFPTGAGVSLGAAEWLAARLPIAVGADTEAFECSPSGVDGNPEPVHVALIWERGIPIMELVNLEKLAEEDTYEFAFVCLPLPIKGATGSMIRPIAIV